jgi:hypothetical protein
MNLSTSEYENMGFDFLNQCVHPILLVTITNLIMNAFKELTMISKATEHGGVLN